MQTSFSISLRAVLLGGVMCFPAAAHAEWIKLEHEKFTVYSDAGERNSVKVLKEMIYADYALDTLTGASKSGKTAPPLRIIMLKQQRDVKKIYNVILDNGQGSEVAGFYSATPTEIAAIVSDVGRAGRKKSSQAFEIAKHEYTHHFQKQHFADAYPTWFLEGFASYIEASETDDGGIKIGWPSRARVNGLSNTSWLSVEQLLNMKGYDLPPSEKHKIYDMGWLMTHYFMSTNERREEMRKTLAAYKNDGEVSEAEFQAITGKTFGEFEKSLKAYYSGEAGVWKLPVAEIAESDITITPLSKGDGESVILLQSVSYKAVSPKQHKDLEKKLRKLGDKFPDSYLLRKANVVFKALNQPSENSVQFANNFVTQNTGKAEPLFWQGEANFRAALKSEDDPAKEKTYLSAAEAAYQASIAIDAKNYRAQYGLARVHAKQRRGSAKVFESLKPAHDLAPQVREITYLIGQNYVNRGEYDKGINLLNQLVVDPHSSGSKLSRAAQRKLTQALMRKAKAQ